MTTAIDALAMLLLLLVSVWVIGFGAIGATLAPAAERGRAAGFTVGALAGPIGVGWLWWRGRHSGDGRGTDRTWPGRRGQGPGDGEATISL